MSIKSITLKDSYGKTATATIAQVPFIMKAMEDSLAKRKDFQLKKGDKVILNFDKKDLQNAIKECTDIMKLHFEIGMNF